MASRLNPWKIQGYKPGQNVVCRIAKAEPGGYAVIIPKDNLPGYLPSNARHNVNDEVLATFVCIDKNRMLLSERFTAGSGKGTGLKPNTTVNWEDQLNELDPNYATGAMQAVPDPYAQQNQFVTGPLPSQPPDAQQSLYDPYAPPMQDQMQPDPYQTQQDQLPPGQQQQYAQPDPYAQQQADPYAIQADPYAQQTDPYADPYSQYATGPLPQQIPDQYLTQPQQTAGPDNWTQAMPPAPPPQPPPQQQQAPQQEWTPPQNAQRYAEGVPSRKFQLRRAIDLIMPPIEEDTLRSMRIGDYDVEWLITQLEGGMHTGCVKAACESRLSRAAMLLYKGRAVGCIYGCKADPATKPTEESLQAMLADLESPDTVVTLYDLPDSITLAMSSLFLGYPVERKDDYSAKEYLDYICNWLGQKSGTATLAISLTQERGTCLGYIYKGNFAGAFYVEDQAFRADRAFVDEMLENDPRAALEVSILPPEMHASAVRFGFSLSMARTRRLE